MAQPPRRPGPPSGVLVAGGVVGLALVAAAVRPPWRFGSHGLFVTRPQGSEPLPPPSAPTAGPYQAPPTSAGLHLPWLPWVLLGLAVLVVAVLVARRLRRRSARTEDVPEVVSPPTETVTVGPDLPTLRRGAVAADERLLAIGDPTDAIVAAWLALQEAAASSGVPRPAAATPTEFTTAVLAGTGAPARPVRTLLGLYLRARFAAAGATAADLVSARTCVRALAEHWSVYASAEATGLDPRTAPDDRPTPRGRRS